jgi:hypothetical protein
MKQKWYKARVIQYVIYGSLYLAVSKLVSFEFSVICALGAIIGEMHHKE